MFTTRTHCLAALLVLAVISSGYADDASTRRGIALFALSYYGQPAPTPSSMNTVEIPDQFASLNDYLQGTGGDEYDRVFVRALGSVDRQIRDVFLDLGRFDVTVMSQRMVPSVLGEFVELFADYTLGRSDSPDAFRFYGEPFAASDLERLARQYVVVVPAVMRYEMQHDDDDHYTAIVETSFSFINTADLRQFGTFTIETRGDDVSSSLAADKAVAAIAGKLSDRVRSMPEFRIRSEVLEVNGEQVVFMHGQDLGIRRGEEYAVVANRVQGDGSLATTETGLVVVNEVLEDRSIATILYATPTISPGDVLQEVPRRGVELQVYTHAITNALADITYVTGLRGVLSRGFYDWRPLVAVEIPLRGVSEGFLLPVSFLVGGEWNAYFGRLRVTPSAAVGFSAAVPLFSDPEVAPVYLSHLGIMFKTAGSVLISRDLMVFVEVGAGFWGGFYRGSDPRISGPMSSYGGLLLGGGVTLR